MFVYRLLAFKKHKFRRPKNCWKCLDVIWSLNRWNTNTPYLPVENVAQQSFLLSHSIDNPYRITMFSMTCWKSKTTGQTCAAYFSDPVKRLPPVACISPDLTIACNRCLCTPSLARHCSIVNCYTSDPSSENIFKSLSWEINCHTFLFMINFIILKQKHASR
jgi:hypothetical protein